MEKVFGIQRGMAGPIYAMGSEVYVQGFVRVPGVLVGMLARKAILHDTSCVALGSCCGIGFSQLIQCKRSPWLTCCLQWRTLGLIGFIGFAIKKLAEFTFAGTLRGSGFAASV